jgi:hypothetical protein
MILFVGVHISRAPDEMIVDMASIHLGCHHIGVLPAKDFISQFYSNLMSCFWGDFPRREGLYQVPPDGIAARAGLPQMMLEGKRCCLRDAMLGMDVQAVAGFVRVTDIAY